MSHYCLHKFLEIVNKQLSYLFFKYARKMPNYMEGRDNRHFLNYWDEVGQRLSSKNFHLFDFGAERGTAGPRFCVVFEAVIYIQLKTC